MRIPNKMIEINNQDGHMNIKERILDARNAYHATQRTWPTEVVLPLEDLEEIETLLGKDPTTVFKMNIVKGDRFEVRQGACK